MTNPITDLEWQEAADAAEFLLLLDSARQYGLLTTDVAPKIERCEEILRLAASRGIAPLSTDQLVKKFMGRTPSP